MNFKAGDIPAPGHLFLGRGVGSEESQYALVYSKNLLGSPAGRTASQ